MFGRYPQVLMVLVLDDVSERKDKIKGFLLLQSLLLRLVFTGDRESESSRKYFSPGEDRKSES